MDWKVLNTAQASELFDKVAICMSERDVVPKHVAEKLFSLEAVDFFLRPCLAGKCHNCCDYGIHGLFTYLTKRGFFDCVSWMNTVTLWPYQKAEWDAKSAEIDRLDAEDAKRGRRHKTAEG